MNVYNMKHPNMKHPNMKHPTTTASQRLCPAGLPHPGRRRGSSAPRGTPGGRTRAVGSPSRCWSPSARPRSSHRHPQPPAGSRPGGGQQPSAQSQSKGTKNPAPKLCRWPWGWVWGFFSCYFSPIGSNSCPHYP